MPASKFLEKTRRKARQLKLDTAALYFAFQDRRTPWYVRVFIAFIVSMAISPIDLIPDFIPILGYLDDFILVPIGITIALKMIPSNVMEEAQKKQKMLRSAKVQAKFMQSLLLLSGYLCYFVLLIHYGTYMEINTYKNKISALIQMILCKR